jgi:5-carboxymethyl-2-hydroxymuconate isomerase
MPHCVILYTPNLDRQTDMGLLCRRLADAMLAVRDEAGKQVFPTPGTRVLAYPAAHYAVADGQGDYAFVYVNVRMAGGRSPGVHQATGEQLSEVVKAHFAPILDAVPVGITVQVDESDGQVYDGKHGSLRRVFGG